MRLAWLEGPARFVAVAFWIATGVFSWLVAVPFAYENFIRPRLLPDFVHFAERHVWFTVALLPVAWLSLRRALQQPRSRPLARGLLAGWGVAALGLPLTPGLAAVQPDGWALPVCFMALIFPVGAAVADLLSADPVADRAPVDRTGGDLLAWALTAAAVGGLYTARAAVAGPLAADGLVASGLTHGLVAAAGFLLLTMVRSVAAVRERPVLAEFWLTAALIAAALAVAVTRLVLPTLSITGGPRWLAGQSFALALALVLAARGRLAGADHGDGVLMALGALVPSRLATPTAWAWALWLPVIPATAAALARASAIIDWNFLVATVGVLVTWGLSLVSALALVSVPATLGLPVRVPHRAAFTVPAAALAAYLALVPPPSHAGTAAPVDAWMVRDPSFRTLREALRPPAPADTGFYPFLQRHTNLAPDIVLRPFDVRHAALADPPAALRPHVFLFVIDSLRRDYVSAYNPANGFTPHLRRFAAESLVFERAFTRYGATGLSVPSIWVGGMVPHRQYPQPYAPYNALYALLMQQRYTPWLSWDNVVDQVVPREGTGPPLSANRAVKDFRFCEMVGDIRSRLDQLTPGGPPVFTWGLAQDIHISAMTREGGAPVDDEPYPGFHPPYASRVRRIDACFGAFVDDLRARGLYDHSVIIVTADHGDSLGEDGRWGHAYTLYPEILQVPLLIHLPPALRDGLAFDLSAPAFTADITPTLHALLGLETTPPAPFFGQSLVWPRGGRRPSRAGTGTLVASSYGSVYGWLSADARELYVSDGVSLRDYRYELDGTPAGRALPVRAEDRRAGQAAIRDALAAIAAFYRYE